MRSGACTVQQTLTTEAASVLKHSLNLARRRGHAQVTPLHVAAALLSTRSSLLRRACLKSQPHHHLQASHPLQCRALELCFNVALNRLPTTPGPLLHGQPSLSNALIAALKRAQAHQRRGCIEQQQQQPLLTIKVELEQLIISILDDPSVSRVMREAGFSSTAVKNNVEDTSASSVFQCYTGGTSGGVFSSPCSPSPPETTRHINNPAATTFWHTHFLTSSSSDQHPALLFSPRRNYFADSASVKEDTKLVLEVLLQERNKRKNIVLLGDCVSATEGLVGEIMGRIERGEVPAEMKQTQFIKFQFAPVSLRFMKKEDVEMNLSELKRKVDSLGDCGAIIYTGDMKWTVEETSVAMGEVTGYSPVDHLVEEIGRLVCDYSSSTTKISLMATANYQTYMRCQMRQPPLAVRWALQAVSVPSAGLGLTLHAPSAIHNSGKPFPQSPSQTLETKPSINSIKELEQEKLTCCPECGASYEKEAQLFKSGQQEHLPSWLQPQCINTNQKDDLMELKRKWNRFCHSLNHQGRHTQSPFDSTLYNKSSLIGNGYSYASSYPWWNAIFPVSNSISFADSPMKPSHNYDVPRFRRQNSCTIEFNFGDVNEKNKPGEPNLGSLKNTDQGKDVKITLALGNSLSSDIGKLEMRSDLCKLLQENVPWQSAVTPCIVSALVESKSSEEDTWLLIQGNDAMGKRRLALAVAEYVLGSADLLLHMNMKRRDIGLVPYSEKLARALRNQERVVALVEDVDLADTKFSKFLADGFQTGRFLELNKREGNIGQAILILTTNDSTSCEDHDSVVQMTLEVNHTKSASFGTPNMGNKRKPEWDLPSISKTQRINEREDTSSVAAENGNKDFSRQSSFNTLDLNIEANEEDDESKDRPGEFSPVSSDLTRETISDHNGFLDVIKNRFVFHRHQGFYEEITEVYLSKVKSCFEKVFGDQKDVVFNIEERVLAALVEGSGSFVNSSFEKWLKDILQTSLQTVKIGGKEGIRVRLDLGSRSDEVLEEGFVGTCLPKKIQVSLMD